MTPNYIKHPDMLALALCTSERYDWSGHICCGYNAHQSGRQLRCKPVGPAALLQSDCNQLAWLQSVSTAARVTSFAALQCIMSDQPQSVSSAATYLL